MAGNPRNGRPYRRLVTQQRGYGLPCWLCGHAIGYQLDARHPLSFTLDHYIPLSRGGSLLDPTNARSAHRRCNSARGNRTERTAAPKTSWRW